MVYSVEFNTPDGVGRVMRLTHGAQKRFADHVERFNPSSQDVGIYSFAYISKNLIELAYYMMYDDQGKPPADLTLEAMREMYAPDDADLFGAVCEALSKGKKKRQETAAQIREVEEALTNSGPKPGPSPVPISVSPARRRPRGNSTESSGTSTRRSSENSSLNITSVTA